MTERLDTMGIWDATLSMPEQMEQALVAADNIEGLPHHDSVENVVVLGMGGSGIAGDVLIAGAGPVLSLPVIVVKSYTLPSFVGRGALVFAVSCSGDTEETLEAAAEAERAGARIVGVTKGGELADLCEDWGEPVIRVPADLPAPRCALAAMSVPLFVVLEDVGLFSGARSWVELAIDQLRRRRDKLAAPGNDMQELARRIGRTFPLAHGGGGVGQVAAYRFRCQVNENANAPAFAGMQPEVCHNEVQGWGQHGDATRQLVTLVRFRHESEHPQVSRRHGIYEVLAREVFAGVEDVIAQGEGDLAQLFDLILQGDVCSLHLAEQEGIDPGPTWALDAMKGALGG